LLLKPAYFRHIAVRFKLTKLEREITVESKRRKRKEKIQCTQSETLSLHQHLVRRRQVQTKHVKGK